MLQFAKLKLYLNIQTVRLGNEYMYRYTTTNDPSNNLQTLDRSRKEQNNTKPEVMSPCSRVKASATTNIVNDKVSETSRRRDNGSSHRPVIRRSTDTLLITHPPFYYSE